MIEYPRYAGNTEDDKQSPKVDKEKCRGADEKDK